jgi:hypothetical protein
MVFLKDPLVSSRKWLGGDDGSWSKRMSSRFSKCRVVQAHSLACKAGRLSHLEGEGKMGDF